MVVWADAHAGPHEWTPLEEVAEEAEEYLVRSVGFHVPVGDGGKPEHVTLIQSITPDDEVDHSLHIPIGMVRGISVLCQTSDVTS